MAILPQELIDTILIAQDQTNEEWISCPQGRGVVEVRVDLKSTEDICTKYFTGATLFIEPGSAWENRYIESFNGKLRDELRNGEIIITFL